MPVHLLEEEVVTIRVLAEKGQKKSEIAKGVHFVFVDKHKKTPK